MPPEPPAAPPAHRPAQRRLLGVAAALVVAVPTGGAFALTYDVLREFALAGRAGERWAPAYPIMVDALVVMTILSLVVARDARWWSRWLRGALLLLLVAGTAAIAVQHALWGFASLPRDPVRAGVAVAPHVMLIIAVWLWLRMIKHFRAPAPRPEPMPAQPAPRPSPPPLALHPTDVEVARKPEPPPLPKADTTPADSIAPINPEAPINLDEEPSAPPTETTPQNEIDTSEDLPIWDWDPPSSSMRSSPTPPTD